MSDDTNREHDIPRAQRVKSGPSGFVADDDEPPITNTSSTAHSDGTGAWNAGTTNIDNTETMTDTTDDDNSTDVTPTDNAQDTLSATVTVDTEPLKKQLNKQIATRTKQKQSKKKVPILSLATGIMGVATTMLTSGRYLVGGALVVSAMAFIALYEVYQVKELPPMVDEEMITDAVEHIVGEVQSKK